MVVTVKFQGDAPDWAALDDVRAVACEHGYAYNCTAASISSTTRTPFILMLRLLEETEDGEPRQDATAKVMTWAWPWAWGAVLSQAAHERARFLPQRLARARRNCAAVVAR